VLFPGGELEGNPTAARCPTCRRFRARRVGAPLCFHCYREGLKRDGALRAAAALDTASNARFQWALPFEPVNGPRLEFLKAIRAADRVARRAGGGDLSERRRRAQVAARHMLRMLEAGLHNRLGSEGHRARTLAAIPHVAELQFPESWLPFVVSR
jgi:hypothetical protein